MKANYEDKIPQKTSEVSLGNLYDMNKQLMEHEIALSSEDRLRIGSKLEEWLENNFAQKYFMLLCHEHRDYTVFNLDKTSTWAAPDLTMLRAARQDIFECLDNRGALLSAELQDDGAWEFWVKDIIDGCAAYYLFPYGDAVLEY